MTECGGRGTAQSSADRSGLHTGFSIFFLCTIVYTHSFFALLCFSLFLQLRPAAGVFLSRSSDTQSLSPRGTFRVFTSHVCPNYVSSSFSLSPLASSTPSSSSPAGSFPADVYLGRLLINLAEAKSAAASADAGGQPTVALSTLAPSSAATDRAASPSRAAGAAAAPYSPRWPVAAITSGASRPTVTAGGVAAATFCSSNNRPAEAVASSGNPPSGAAVAAAHSPSSECLYAGAYAASSSRCGAAAAASWPSTSHATGATACAAIGLRQLGPQSCCCSLRAALNIRRCAPLSRQQPQGLRCGFLSSLSRCSSPKCWTPQRRQQQPRWQAPGASLSCGSRALSGRKEKAAQGGERRRNSGRNNNSSSYAAAAAAAASAVSAAAARERRPATALFDSQEERFSALKSLKEQETPKFQAEDWTAEMPLLEVKDLHVVAVEDGQEILKGVNLTVMPGEVHAIMGRNGSGKSTLSKVLAGYPSYKVTRGSVRYKGLDLLELAIDNRGLAGLFLAFQYPIEIPMVSNLEFLRVAFNQRRKWRGEEEVDSVEFRKFVEGKLHEVGLDASFLSRPLNYGFSGGEKKRNEILQMIVLDPELVMLDETDSGLDVDSFNVTAAAIKRFAGRKNKSFLVTTHYKKLLDVLRPHKIHVMHAGRVILSGDLSLASRIEKEGFASLISDDPREEEEERRGLARGENLLENDDAYEPPSLSPSAAGGGRRDFDKLL